MRLALRLVLSLSIGVSAAHATPFGTRSSAWIDPPGDAHDGFAEEQTVDQPVSTSSTWLTDGATTAGAITPFGANHVFATSRAGTASSSASLWADTWTVASESGGGSSGSAWIELHLHLAGALGAGAERGGYAQLALRALLGEPGDALVPNVLFAGGSLIRDAACDGFACAERQDVEDRLVVRAAVPYDTPFRFALLLEALAWGGAGTATESSAWLARIALPDGARLFAASGMELSHVVASVPEPSALLLIAAGLVTFARRRRRA